MANVRATDGTAVIWCHKGKTIADELNFPEGTDKSRIGAALRIEYDQNSQNTMGYMRVLLFESKWGTNTGAVLDSKSSVTLPAITLPTLGSFARGDVTYTGAKPPGMSQAFTGSGSAYSIVFYGTPTSAGLFNYTVTLTQNVLNWRGAVQSEWLTHFPVEFHIYANSFLNQNANGGKFSDQSTVITQTVDGYTAPTYTITTAVPTRAGYTFLGWSTSSTATSASYSSGGSYTGVLDGTSTLYAVWKLNTYTVTIATNNSSYGTVSPTSITNVPYGASISVSSNKVTINGTTSTASPSSATAQYSYAFSSWSNTSGTITANRTITANFTRTTRTYTVTWKNWDNTTLETDTGVAYGTTPTYNSATPTRATTAQYTYTFIGWSPTVGAITGNTTYTAQFSSTVRTYTVTWKNYDDTVLETDTGVAYGSTPAYNGSTPTKSSTAQYSYTFSGWSPTVATVTGNATYTAQFSSTVRSYTVTLTSNGNGTVSGGGTYNYGSTANISATPNSGYKFVQWSDRDTNASRSFTVTGNVTLSATFAVAIAETNVKVNGSWVQGSVYVKVSGSWVGSKRIYTKVDGEWIKANGNGPAKYWAVDIAKSTSDPSSRCTYPQTIIVNGRTKNNECYGYTPMSGSSSGTFSHGSWDGSDLISGIKPVSKDGTTWTDQVINASSWSNNTSGSSDYFTEFPFYWLSITNDSSKIRVIFSNADFQPDDTFQCYAHAKGCDSYSNSQIESAVTTVSRADILENNDNTFYANSFHIGCFLANGSSSGIYSKKGSTLLVSTPYASYWQGANARGTDYDCISFQQLTYLQALFVLLFKSTNSQGTHSSGYSGGNAVPTTQAGLSTDKYGMSGKISGNTTRMSFFWIHDLWGSINQYIGGLWERGDGTRNMYYWLPRQANSRAFTNGWTASSTATTQASLGTSATTGSNSWHFIGAVAGTNKGGFYPTAQSGATATTYFCDIGYTESSTANANFPTIGGFFNSDTYNGIFYVETNRASTFSHSSWACRLAYRGGH